MKAFVSTLSILALAATLNAAEGDKKPEGDAPKKPSAEGDAPKRPSAEGDKGKPKFNPEEMFKRLDKDSNGSISKEEFLASPGAKKDAAKAEERFGKMDKNSDGSLSKEEMTHAPKKKKDA